MLWLCGINKGTWKLPALPCPSSGNSLLQSPSGPTPNRQPPTLHLPQPSRTSPMDSLLLLPSIPQPMALWPNNLSRILELPRVRLIWLGATLLFWPLFMLVTVLPLPAGALKDFLQLLAAELGALVWFKSLSTFKPPLSMEVCNHVVIISLSTF